MEIPSLFDTAQSFVAKALWGQEVVSYRSLEKSLARHRETSEAKLSKLNLPQFIASSLKQIFSAFELSYNDAYQWLRMYREEIILGKVAILSGTYSFRNFIMPFGNFDDKNWVKQLIDDQEVDLLIRFYFACCYCVEEKIRLLWQEISRDSYLKNEVHRRWIFSSFPNLVSTWVHDINPVNENNPHDHWLYGFLFGHEHAVRFCMDTRRGFFNFSDVLEYVAYPKIVHMLFSQLSHEIQLQYLQSNVMLQGNKSIFKYYINPLIVKHLPNLIQLHQDSLRETIFIEVLSNLALKISQLSSPIYRSIFCQIWEIGSERNKSYFLENDQDAMFHLFWSKDFTSAKCVLKDSSVLQKRRILFQTAEKILASSKTASFSENDFRQYLLIFLLNDNVANIVNTLRDKMKLHPKSSDLLAELRERVYQVYGFRRSKKHKRKKYNATKRRAMCLNAIESLICEVKTFERLEAE